MAAVAAALGVLSACGHGGPQPHTTAPVPVPSTSASAGVLGQFVPATGAEFAAGARFEETEQSLQDIPVSRCMKRHGLTIPAGTASAAAAADVDNSQFPDLTRIRATSRFIPAGARPVQAAPAGQPDAGAYSTALKTCAAAAGSMFGPLDSAGTELQDQWMSVVSGIEASQPVRLTIPAFQRCLAGAGVPASAEQAGGTGPDGSSSSSAQALGDFLAWESGQESRQATQASVTATAARWAQVFARCAAPVVEAVEREQTAAREKFLSAHGQQVRTLGRLASQEISQAEQRYGAPGAA